MRFGGAGHGMVALAVAALIAGVMGAVTRGAAPDRFETLVYAVYDGQDTATHVFRTMRSAQSATRERIESYAVVSKDLQGKVTVRDQRRRDAGVGAVVGGVIGLLGGPLGVAADASAGGAAGYLTGNAVGIPRDKVESMKQSLTAGSSALVVVLDDRWLKDVYFYLDGANARLVISNEIASK